MMSQWRWNGIIVALLAVCVLLQYRLWFEPGGVCELAKLKQTIAEQTADNEKLKQRNEALLFQVKRIQNSKDAVESHARNELGMIKKGEMFYQIVQ